MRHYSIVYLTFFVGLLCAIFPLPMFFNGFRPEWMILLIAYWVLALPLRIGIVHAFFLGLILDILLGSMLGMHALLFALFAYFICMHYQRIRYFSLVQTTLLVGLSVLCIKLGLFWIASTQQDIILHKNYFWSIFSSMLIWPWFFLFLRMIRIRFKVL